MSQNIFKKITQHLGNILRIKTIGLIGAILGVVESDFKWKGHWKAYSLTPFSFLSA